jgi:hypothetical protein
MFANTNPLDFFAKHGLMSDPREHAYMFSDLPDDIPALCKVVQGLLIHEVWAGAYGVSIPDDRRLEPSIRMIADKLERMQQLDDRPLIEARPAERRLVSICRDFALLLTAMLRHKNISARTRFGFATYFNPPDAAEAYCDRVITEYWHEADQRWVLVDSQLDELQLGTIHINIDPCDISREIFLTGDVAWQRCASGEATPENFGFPGTYTGWGYVRGHLARDIAALNKVEMQCWDYWGIFERRNSDLPDEDLKLLNHAADLSMAGNEAFEELRSLYLRDMRLRVPPVIKSWYVEDEEEFRLKEFLGRNLSLAKFL